MYAISEEWSHWYLAASGCKLHVVDNSGKMITDVLGGIDFGQWKKVTVEEKGKTEDCFLQHDKDRFPKIYWSTG